MTRRESEVAKLYGRFSARELAVQFTTSADAIWMMMSRVRRKCPVYQSATRRPCGRVRCASQIGSADAPLNLDSLN